MGLSIPSRRQVSQHSRSPAGAAGLLFVAAFGLTGIVFCPGLTFPLL
jgi:hypothetical protein